MRCPPPFPRLLKQDSRDGKGRGGCREELTGATANTKNGCGTNTHTHTHTLQQEHMLELTAVERRKERERERKKEQDSVVLL